MSDTRSIVTSGLPYSNGRLHVGHIAGAYLPADTYVRYLRSRGREALFVCGSDDNGVAALISAAKEERDVRELTADYRERQARDFKGLGIEFDIFGGTHHPDFVKTHERLSQSFFQSIYDKGYFTKRTSEQLYDPAHDRFLPDRYVRGTCYHELPDGTICGYKDAYGDQCESCGRAIEPLRLIDPVSTLSGNTPIPKETIHWYLRLDKFETALRDWLSSKRQADSDRPAWRESVLNFCLGQIKNGLPERAMTRDLNWGVPVPLDDPDAEGKVLYVWFDAPIGYVSFTQKLLADRGESETAYEHWWKDEDSRIVHFIGEDNTVFHALIWPAMLMAEGSYQLPWQVVANSFLNIKFPGKEEEKISKSRGTAVWVEEYLQSYDPDPLRYYLTAIAPENSRTAFDFDDFIRRNNGELLAALGNFVNRTITFTHKYFDGVVPPIGQRDTVDEQQLAARGTRLAAIAENLEAFHFKAALGELMALARDGNVYMDTKAPWKQRKTDLAACGTSINVCVQIVQTLTVAMAPFLPHMAIKAAQMLQHENEAEGKWGAALQEIPGGRTLGPAEMLVRKLELES